MSGWCPAGKIKCGNHHDANSFGAPKRCDWGGEGYLELDKIEVCPWPSRQVSVKLNGRYCPDIKRDCQYLTPSAEELNEMLAKAKATGRLEGIEECEDIIKFWPQTYLFCESSALAAIAKLMDRAAGPKEK